MERGVPDIGEESNIFWPRIEVPSHPGMLAVSVVCRIAFREAVHQRCAFSSSKIFLSEPLASLEGNGVEAGDKEVKPSQVYQRRVQRGDLSADQHQQKVIRQVSDLNLALSSHLLMSYLIYVQSTQLNVA